MTHTPGPIDEGDDHSSGMTIGISDVHGENRETDPNEDEEHFDDLEYEDEDEDPWDLHDYEGESPESLRNWYNGRVL